MIFFWGGAGKNLSNSRMKMIILDVKIKTNVFRINILIKFVVNFFFSCDLREWPKQRKRGLLFGWR